MRIERDIIDFFKRWREQPERKSIQLKGARQIGKTWARKNLARNVLIIALN